MLKMINNNNFQIMYRKYKISILFDTTTKEAREIVIFDEKDRNITRTVCRPAQNINKVDNTIPSPGGETLALIFSWIDTYHGIQLDNTHHSFIR